MKKLLLLALSSLILQTLQAQDQIKAQIVIDDISRVSISVNEVDYPNVVNGLNTILVDPGSSVTISARTGCRLISVIGSDTQGNTWEEYIIELRQCIIRYYSDYNETYTVTSALDQEAQTAQCTLQVDDASKIKVVRKASQNEISLVNGDNLIKFDPTSETELVISPTDKPIYKITVNGTDITEASAYSYNVAIADGTRINVEANYPDVMCPVHLILEGNGAEDFITGADVDGSPVFNFKSPDFAVKSGSELKLYANTNEWEIEECSVNGEIVSSLNAFVNIITEETTIRFKVHKYATFLMTITIDDPTRVDVFRGYSYNGDKIDLKAGQNEVEIMRNTPIVSLVPVEGYYIESCQIDGYSYPREDIQIAPVRIGQLADGSNLIITSGTIVRDQQAMVYLHNLSKAVGYFKILRADRSEITDLKEGYNSLPFYQNDNTFIVETGGPFKSYLYLNEKKIAPKYEDSFDYLIDFDTNDVLKVFFEEEPTSYQVTFEVEGIPLNVIRDEIVQVTNFKEGFKALQGTTVTMTYHPDIKLEITVNGQPVENTFTVTSDTHVNVIAKGNSIQQVQSETFSSGAVYNAQGILILQNATAEDIARLPQGLYLKDGKKFIKN